MFKPVPTAVPLYANSLNIGSLDLIRSIEFFIICVYPENSWPKVRGVASYVWVLPIFIILSNSLVFYSNATNKALSPGNKTLWTSKTVAICIAVGNVSFEL